MSGGPNSGGISIDMWSAESGTFRVKTRNIQTDSSNTINAGGSTYWSYDDLINVGFKEGDSCWVSVDIDGGETNHESGNNFTLAQNWPILTYGLRGGLWNPSWDGPQ
ncbi:uncharacterized protein Z520_00029 [Fonsecaea multimorphosa CBS 102226]|uniref:Uncharacterized protein n=1 Tax=Fonsecaea multimorphosa CBS 102226 TaxID=1442371 RepID=A0A0D2KBC3_9EURO|nr:uncharacterized protein Z520_00029 [Fonsecaea multimorphosa CBS 102226]KIY03338.1 hypothetical protein Z520_00029 [Fonsecaea multimorphosa CBS 102226]OAL32989.1 hypothetical protein AYO22_00074 [Fonsecaea multimorphosa]